MLKKAGVIAAAAAGLLMLGAPAFAGGVEGPGVNSWNGQIGLVNLNGIDILEDINLNAVVGACDNDLGLLGSIVPIMSPSATGSCAAGGVSD
ncbi:MAG: hypothetical protein ABW224_04870 [Kibdelosporangium sp.]